MYLGMNMLVQEKQSKVDMKLIKFIICFVLILSLNNNAKALSGVGPLSFSEGTFEWFLAYLRGDGQTTGEVGFRQGYPGGFAVNPEGNYGYYSIWVNRNNNVFDNLDYKPNNQVKNLSELVDLI